MMTSQRRWATVCMGVAWTDRVTGFMGVMSQFKWATEV